MQAAEGQRFLALGYQQTDLPASKGGLVLNTNGFRFRPKAMRALARTFRGNPFITGHDWGDVRARGGTIADAYTEDIEQLTDAPANAPAATGIYYEINATADWAIEGLENGTIDRFSLGVVPQGEVMCTAHDVPAWTGGCWCFPGELVTVYEENAKGEKVEREVIAEWEYAGGIGVELSCVNVAAVDGTHIIEADDEEEGDEDIEASVRELALLCGRARPRMPSRPRAAAVAGAAGAAHAGVFTPAAAAPNMAESTPTGEHQMDRIALCRRLNLPTTASDDEINARLDQVTAAEAQHGNELAAARSREAALAAEVLSQHVDGEIARLTRERQVPAATITELRAAATATDGGGRARFDRELSLVERHAPRNAPPVGGTRPVLQSDAPALAAPSDEGAALAEGDAYEQHKDNAALPKLMRACKITAADIRKHGPKAITVVPDLAELSARTSARI